jgi:ATP-binding cassette subfamily C (CFTR/MRP) protein 1
MILTTCTQMFTLIHGSQSLDATRAFTTLSLVMLLAGPVGNLIHAVPMCQTALASVDRIQAFLKLDEVHEPVAPPRVNYPMVHRNTTGNARNDEVIELEAVIATSGEHSHSTSERSDICLTNVSVQLGTEQKAVLHNISVKIPHSSLTLILGPVGCGKTTLLRALVGDVPLSAGSLQHDPRSATSAYCAQNPWLPSDTLDSLIVGPNGYDEQWLSTVVEACALGTDLSTFHDGLQTLIGSNGVSLSGGQRQRLALARALYTRQSLLVVDDALSGLDANTANHVFSEVFGPSGLCKVHDITAVLVTNDVKHLSQADHIILLGTGGRVLEQGGPEKLLHVKGHAQAIAASSGETSGKQTERGAALEVKPKLASSAVEDKQHDLARRTGDIAVYWYYMRSIGWLYGSVVLVSALIYAFGLKFGDVWVRWWSEDSFELSLGSWVGVYVMLACIALASDGLEIWAFLVWTVPKSSGRLHELLLNAVMRAPYQFFAKTDAGVTLNR